MFNRVVQPIARIAQRSARKYHNDERFRYPSMDELPLPQGSWQANYDAKQRKYNMQLLLGIFLFSAAFMHSKYNGALYLNYYPPDDSKDMENEKSE